MYYGESVGCIERWWGLYSRLVRTLEFGVVCVFEEYYTVYRFARLTYLRLLNRFTTSGTHTITATLANRPTPHGYAPSPTGSAPSAKPHTAVNAT